jgi:hypothetical protein
VEQYPLDAWGYQPATETLNKNYAEPSAYIDLTYIQLRVGYEIFVLGGYSTSGYVEDIDETVSITQSNLALEFLLKYPFILNKFVFFHVSGLSTTTIW